MPGRPELRFNLSHSQEMALVAVALEIEVGVDVERIRPLPEFIAIARRFFPPGEPLPRDAEEFFRAWTRIEAQLKARGVGLYGAGMEIEGEWTLAPINAGDGYAAAVAAPKPGLRVIVRDFAAPGPD
jgi:4'-phosphopantetheinyl transferase